MNIPAISAAASLHSIQLASRRFGSSTDGEHTITSINVPKIQAGDATTINKVKALSILYRVIMVNNGHPRASGSVKKQIAAASGIPAKDIGLLIKTGDTDFSSERGRQLGKICQAAGLGTWTDLQKAAAKLESNKSGQSLKLKISAPQEVGETEAKPTKTEPAAEQGERKTEELKITIATWPASVREHAENQQLKALHLLREMILTKHPLTSERINLKKLGQAINLSSINSKGGILYLTEPNFSEHRLTHLNNVAQVFGFRSFDYLVALARTLDIKEQGKLQFTAEISTPDLNLFAKASKAKKASIEEVIAKLGKEINSTEATVRIRTGQTKHYQKALALLRAIPPALDLTVKAFETYLGHGMPSVTGESQAAALESKMSTAYKRHALICQTLGVDWDEIVTAARSINVSDRTATVRFKKPIEIGDFKKRYAELKG